MALSFIKYSRRVFYMKKIKIWNFLGKILFFNIFLIRKWVSKIFKATFFGKNIFCEVPCIDLFNKTQLRTIRIRVNFQVFLEFAHLAFLKIHSSSCLNRKKRFGFQVLYQKVSNNITTITLPSCQLELFSCFFRRIKIFYNLIVKI